MREHTCHGNEHMPPGPCLSCVVDVAEYRASHNGCEGGMDDGICCLDQPMVTRWCDYCLLGEMAKALIANVSAATRNDSVVAEGVTFPVGEKPALKRCSCVGVSIDSRHPGICATCGRPSGYGETALNMGSAMEDCRVCGRPLGSTGCGHRLKR